MKSIKGKKYKGLYELRIKFSNDIARIFYFTYYNQEIILLNGFIKKTMKTPKRDIWMILSGGEKMDKSSISMENLRERLFQDEEFKKEYEKLGPRYELVSLIIKTRLEQNLTQEELARRIGTKKSNISRLESGKYNPSLDFIIKVAEAFGKKVKLDFF